MIGRLFRKLTRPPICRSLAEALEAARQLPPPVVLQCLTGPATNVAQVHQVLTELEAIIDSDFEIQLRFTQLGLDFSIALVMESVTRLLERGGQHRTLWVEMEADSQDVTHELLRRVGLRYPNIQLARGQSRVVRYTPVR